MLTLDFLRTKRNLLFWTLHTAGWAAYAVTQYFGALLYEEKPPSYGQVILIAAVAGFALSIPMRSVYRRLRGRSPRLWSGARRSKTSLSQAESGRARYFALFRKG